MAKSRSRRPSTERKERKQGWKMLKLRATAPGRLLAECQALVHQWSWGQALGHLMVLTAGYDRCSLSLLRGRREQMCSHHAVKKL